jgi:regulator of protease activity HflC (stomatin/prohibitin superfamily)
VCRCAHRVWPDGPDRAAARAYVVERLGSYSRTLDAGLNTVVPFIDRVRARVDLREQVVSFAPQPVITEDNLVVRIDTVLYFQVTDPKAATYEIAGFIQAIEQLTVTTLRNVIGGMDLERTLTSREQINAELRGVLDEATGKWGIRVNRVELKAIDPPESITDAMEKRLRADRDKRAAILTAKGARQAQILTAEGAQQAAILTAEGNSRPRYSSPRDRPKPSAPYSKRSTGDGQTPDCSPTSTCRRYPR